MKRNRRVLEGQVLVLAALLLLILLVMVGISFDTGRTYDQDRTLEQGVNAAALGAVDLMLQVNANPGITDNDVSNLIHRTLVANKIDSPVRVNDINIAVDADQTSYIAHYVKQNGHYTDRLVGDYGNMRPPRDAFYVVIEAREEVSTYFARLVGRATLPARAVASAGICAPADGIYPFVINQQDFPTDTPVGTTKDILLNQGNDIAPPGSFGWLTWGIENNPAGPGSLGNLERSLTIPGNLSEGFDEASISTGEHGPTTGMLEVGDWVNTSTGTSAGNEVRDRLRTLSTGNNGGPYTIILPMSSGHQGTGENAAYKISRLGLFQIVRENLPQYLRLRYMGESVGSACGIAPPPPPGPVGIDGYVDEIIVSSELTEQTQDILIVYDLSSSMKFGWNSHTSTSAPNRRLDATAPAMRNFIDEVFKYTPGPGVNPPDDMIEVITFGGGSNTARVARGWGDYTQKTNLRNAIPTDGTAYGSNTPTAAAMTLAYNEIRNRPNTRSVQVADASQPTGFRNVTKKVKKIVVLVTDGAANVLYNTTAQNCKTSAPVNSPSDCGDNPIYQARTVATDSQYTIDHSVPRNGNPFPLAPISYIKWQANVIKSEGIEIFAIGAAMEINGYRASDYQLYDMVSPSWQTHYYAAASAIEMGQVVTQMRQYMDQQRCFGVETLPRPAMGGRVYLYDSADMSRTIREATLGVNGRYAFSGLDPDRTYTIRAEHLNVQGFDKPPPAAFRDYNHMTSYGGTEVGDISRYIPPGSNGTVDMTDIRLTVEGEYVDGEWVPQDVCAGR